VLIYDRECSLCRASVAWVRRRDTGEAIELLAFQDPACARRFPALGGEKCLRAVRFADESGALSRGADAVGLVLERLPGTRWLGRGLAFPPLRALARLGYEVVARVRPRDRCPVTFG
jgi:predicted DCC family thiol-disulfide oxidoreductase YuxK